MPRQIPVLTVLGLATVTLTSAAGSDTPSASSAAPSPSYPCAYELTSADQIRAMIDRVISYLEDASLIRIIDRAAGHPVTDLAQLGALTGDVGYFDDAVRQSIRFSARMFVLANVLHHHGWIENMGPHPSLNRARANGWAVAAMAALLAVLPVDRSGRAAALAQLRVHGAGLAAAQSGSGLSHQLLDRPDPYLAASASAMFVYAFARGINRGWLDAKAYMPIVSVYWSAVAAKVNTAGQVDGTCVGTGTGFGPMFYYRRPTDSLAAYGYGPALLAGSEMIHLRHGAGADAVIHGGGLHFARAFEN
ncbi:MAG TPA: glycoside hydrolase family 88 protein [Opitutaceae bacterium]|nr:glycoside hydrolase family 88 protein [Opitutaceae bacterium]